MKGFDQAENHEFWSGCCGLNNVVWHKPFICFSLERQRMDAEEDADWASKHVDKDGILKDGFTRLLDVLTADNVIEYVGRAYESVLLQGIHVALSSESDE
nr:beta-hexosaminidase 3 [Tanacetum cinerariifolium]